MDEKRGELLLRLWAAQDAAYDLMCEYDSLPHQYGDTVLYQAEGHIIDLIATYPGVTITDLSNILKKTPSACSQIVRKLREKGFVDQTRNKSNNRQLNLSLTNAGERVYANHMSFNKDCKEATFRLLEEYTIEELMAHVRVQERLNQAYQADVKKSRSNFLSED